MNLTHDQAQAYLESSPDNLHPVEMRALLEHLEGCDICREYRVEVQRRERLIQSSLQTGQPRRQFTHAELKAISARLQRRIVFRRLFAWLGGGVQTLTWAGLTAALVFGLAWLINHLPQPAPEPAATAIAQILPSDLQINPTPAIPIVPPTAPVPTLPAVPPISYKHIQSLQEHDSSVTSVAYTPDGKQLASADAAGLVNLWNAEDGALLYSIQAHTKGVTTLAFDPIGRTFATGSKDGKVKLWNTQTGDLLHELLSDSSPVKSLAFSPNGEMLAVSMSQSQAYIFRLSTGMMLSSSQAHTRFDVSTDTINNYVLASSETAVWLDNASNVPFAITLRGQGGRSLDAVLSSDGKLLASGSTDQKIYLWQIYDISYVLHNDETFTSTTERLVSGPLKLILEGHTGWVTSLAFLPDQHTLVSGSTDGTLKIWALADGQVITTLTGHQSAINSVAVSPNGQWIASASDDGTIYLWKLTHP